MLPNSVWMFIESETMPEILTLPSPVVFTSTSATNIQKLQVLAIYSATFIDYFVFVYYHSEVVPESDNKYHVVFCRLHQLEFHKHQNLY